MVGMAKSKKPTGPAPDPNSKRSRGVPRNIHPRKVFHAPQELFTALEKYVATTKPRATESSAIRDALEDYLKARGFWPPDGAGT